jgi:accessory gene regulator protein AgrB
VNAQDLTLSTPLNVAAYHKFDDIAALLLENGTFLILILILTLALTYSYSLSQALFWTLIHGYVSL